MSILKKLENHFNNFNGKEVLKETTILALSHDGRVFGQLGKIKSDKDIQSLGALLVGMWQASEAVGEFLSGNDEKDLILSFQSSDKGFFLLRPTEKNKEVFWGILFESEVNPGKIKLYAKKVREFFDKIKIIESKDMENIQDGDFLFKNITEDEVDKLFSFAGL
ncbi:MAG: hypothetical protein K9K67_02485 [Bacteriovoracaceae bacterium]|nr:hypothetical protein [Bacteriovoracaceae bacterium]